MKVLVPAFLSIIALAGCTSVEQSTRISSTLRAREFNGVASQYMDQPTFVSTNKMSDGKTLLVVRMQTYGLPHVYDSLNLSPDAQESLKHYDISFLKDDVPGYVAAIDKFADWESLASARKDQFTKEISSVPTWGNGGANVSLKFTFHSGNEHDHFLVISVHSMGIDTGDAEYFDLPNAKELKRLLLAFGSDSLQHTDIDSVYK